MAKWKTRIVSPCELQLDVLNDRIEVSPNAKQAEIRAALYEHEDVVGMIKDIVETKGLIPIERIVVIEVKRQIVVLEGNRRVCACQAIIDNKTIPIDYQKRLVAYTYDPPKALLAAISQIEVLVAPKREDADVAITRKHTDPAIKPWSPQAKFRRIKRLLKQGKTFEQIVEQFKQDGSTVLRTMRELGMLEYALGLPVWTPTEKAVLSSPKIKVTSFLRFFQLGGVCPALSVGYDDKGGIVEPKEKVLFRRAIELLARQLLLPNPETGKSSHNTRTPVDAIFGKIEELDPRLSSFINRDRNKTPGQRTNAEKSVGNPVGDSPPDSNAEQPKDGSGRSPSTPPPEANKPGPVPKTVKFFEDLECYVDDDILKNYAREIRMINYKAFPTSAAFLMRALVEQTLKRCILNGNKFAEFKQSMLQAQGPGKPVTGNCKSCNAAVSLPAPVRQGKDPGLSDYLTFCIANADQLFVPPEGARRNLNSWRSNTNEYVNIVIHGHYQIATEARLIDAAKTLRPFIKNILHKKADA